MPAFILNQPATRHPANVPAGKAHPFYSLDSFARGYVEAMFFTNCDSGEDREHLANELGVERLTRASVKAIKADCSAFLSHIMPDGCFVRQWLDRVPHYDDEQAGRDFWLTRQGHGAGFWDRDQLAADAAEYYATIEAPGQWDCGRQQAVLAIRGKSIGEHLSDAARYAGERCPEIYRGWIHYS